MPADIRYGVTTRRRWAATSLTAAKNASSCGASRQLGPRFFNITDFEMKCLYTPPELESGRLDRREFAIRPAYCIDFDTRADKAGARVLRGRVGTALLAGGENQAVSDVAILC